MTTRTASQYPAQPVLDPIELSLHSPLGHPQLCGNLGGGLTIVIFPIKELAVPGRQRLQRPPQRLLPLPAQQLLLRRRRFRRELRRQRFQRYAAALPPCFIQRGIAGNGSEPSCEAAPGRVKGVDLLPNPQDNFRETFLPVLVIGQNRPDDIAYQRGVVDEKRRRSGLLPRPQLPDNLLFHLSRPLSLPILSYTAT